MEISCTRPAPAKGGGFFKIQNIFSKLTHYSYDMIIYFVLVYSFRYKKKKKLNGTYSPQNILP